MKTRDELGAILNKLYWRCEHGEHDKAVNELSLIQSYAFIEGRNSLKEENEADKATREKPL